MSLVVAVLGLGEVGRVVVEELSGQHEVRAWDVAFADPTSPASGNATALGLAPSADARSAVADADVVISAVTAANSVAVATDCAPGLRTGAWFVDLNSSSPAHKQAAAAVVEAAGGRYVEVAVMSPIEPRRLSSPMLLGGPHAAALLAEVGGPLGLGGATVYSDALGPAAATKLCRSVVVKGLEALVSESLCAARAWGVERAVLDSLGDLVPGPDWEQLSGYLVSRTVQHGRRRAEEMREAAATVAETGIPAWMSEATAQRQDWAADAAAGGVAPQPDDLWAMVDALRKQGSAS